MKPQSALTSRLVGPPAKREVRGVFRSCIQTSSFLRVDPKLNQSSGFFKISRACRKRNTEDSCGHGDSVGTELRERGGPAARELISML
jgi:hypothetical protein